ncbi:MAG: hypothetical protein JSV89_13570 [Spirochaetaceae bacterium]|nr:MAG: hypothetical protein JSV89_13570 [Spirochaetaceae bacterium]
MKRTISCRRARREVQNLLDRVDLVFLAHSENMPNFMPAELKAHLEQCTECREFFQTLSTFAPALRDQLDAALRNFSAPAFETVLQEQTETARQGGVEYEERKDTGRSIAAAFHRLSRRLFCWLFGPVQRPVIRWAAVSAAGLLLASLIGLRVYNTYTTNRAIEQQLDRVVELIYQEPLLSGIESALLRTRPTLFDYVEDLSRDTDGWLESTTSESYLN